MKNLPENRSCYSILTTTSLVTLIFLASCYAGVRFNERGQVVNRRGEVIRTSADRDDSEAAAAAPLLSEEPLDTAIAEAIRQGATMEEIAQLREPAARTPAEALRLLKEGNARFFSKQARRPEQSAHERITSIMAQTPFAVILGCSDSRVPVEIVYDQGLGDLFAIRVAGNLVDPASAGSIEYAVTHLKSHLIVVMGHEGCGAVQAALLPETARSAEAENVRYLLDSMQPAVANVPELQDTRARKREATVANVRHQVEQLKKNPVITQAIADGKITVVGAYYNISSGVVDFYE
jgi:carbonic anhydrase